MQVFGCRDDGEVAAKFMTGVLNLPEVQKLLSSEHFSMDGTLIEAWASMKSLVPKDDADPPRQQGGRNGERDFRGEKRSNATHASTTDPEARLFRKGQLRVSCSPSDSLPLGATGYIPRFFSFRSPAGLPRRPGFRPAPGTCNA